MLAGKYDLIHTYTCDDHLLFKYPHDRTYAAVATVHLNYHEFTSRQINVLRSYDKVIVLNSREKEWMINRGIDAEYIPHGFSRPVYQCNYFYKEQYCDKINICFSGVCYRDYQRLLALISFIQKRDDIRLHILGQREYIKRMLRKRNFPNVIVYDHLSDDDYYSLLSMCDYSFLPLTFASANNTLLEAQFLGVRSIVPRMEGIMDYAAVKDNLFFSGNDELKNIVSSLKKEEMSTAVMEYAKRFMWDKIYRETKKVYKESMQRHGLY